MRDLEERLRAAADAHRPDRERMLARIRRGTATTGTGPAYRRRPAMSWPRTALVALVSATALLFCAYTVASVVQRPGPHRDAARDPVVLSPAPQPPPTPGRVTPVPVTPAPPTGGPPEARAAHGPLSSDGSVDPHSNAYWAQNNLTLRTSAPLTSLTVEVRVAQTGGVAPTGSWRTLPETDFTVTVRESGGALVHRWTLKPGRGVPPGRHVFAVQYNHAAGARDAKGDTYAVTATAAGERYTVTGTF
ncbi:hypothetical protein ACLGI4_13450 [Streptomyces sp. HMX112]|uniref:hypothetical protein n=1 Tax=Streptomyces sp. HMX112 TaxID=3390850 RepID=UPI003A7F644C